ncbi:hypothetical protein QCM77_19145 [Bradyrhizobium sp. SSUT18]|uniref:hypothetical protein n=1 Tax=unclassified Bradyrhizobium TaxID=2631580 RepID=UPI002448DE7A|nr:MULTISPECIES: hypothetical protein [unclassified Bradyrhizobium]MDH2342762.1 hypothetical protein [Bradyrhizobium sp. SSUT77]MDH2352922.1 hypothetical protein [Bradyrhizobium sp. SSUT112]MDH2402058.1 hypothetical protein [Bradyrhizobium sp. SSUT18]
MLLILAMMFFLFLPITDRKTVRMKLGMLCALLAVFLVSVTRTHVAPVRLAGIASTHGGLQAPPLMSISKPSSGLSSQHAWDMRLIHGPGNI